MNLVSFLIVNYNTGEILRKCIESIFRFENKINFEVIVVDNNSTDNSKVIIKELTYVHTKLKPIYLSQKKGFSFANNRAIEEASGNFALIMNPDIFFTEPVLETLISDLNQNEKLGAVCPLLLGEDGKFQSQYFQKYPTTLQFIFFYSVFGKLLIKFKPLVNKYFYNMVNVNSHKLEHVEQIPCAFFLTRTKFLAEAGGMDESYDLFFEDVDLSYQMNKKYALAVDTNIKITHLGGASFKTSDDYWLYGRFVISMINFFRKNYGASQTYILKTLAIINSHLILIAEETKKVFGKNDIYRENKHKYFLTELRKINT
ncbi:MAG: glycosyltransferase [Ignavibacteria bacterium]